MSHKDKKTQMRIDPRLKDGINAAAAARGMFGYQLLEEIIKKWLLDNERGIYMKIKNRKLPKN